MAKKKINVINLWGPEFECPLCGKIHQSNVALPMYEGQVVPDDYEGEYACFPVCQECFDKHRKDEDHE